jgi:hypothetical protein
MYVYLQAFFLLKALHGICKERGAIVTEHLHSRCWRSRNGFNGCFQINVVIIELNKIELQIVHVQYITHCLGQFVHARLKLLRVPKTARICVLHIRIEHCRLLELVVERLSRQVTYRDIKSMHLMFRLLFGTISEG